MASTGLLHERVILITGAGAGIGRAVACACAAEGATVILLGRTLRKLEQVYDTILHAGHPMPAIYPMDLAGATPEDYAALAAVVGKEFGRLDGLVHNAGVIGGLTPIAHYDVERWYRTLQVNLNAPLLLTQAITELLSTAQEASVIFTEDRFAAQGQAYWGAYAVAKGATHTLMLLLASELESSGIRVNSIDPGRVRTEWVRKIYPGRDPHTWATPESVVAPYLHLLGPNSQGMTGQTLSA